MSFNEPESIAPGVPAEEERRVFDHIYALLKDGGVFLGNFWVNHPGGNGHFEIRVEHNGETVSMKSARCFPEIFFRENSHVS